MVADVIEHICPSAPSFLYTSDFKNSTIKKSNSPWSLFMCVLWHIKAEEKPKVRLCIIWWLAQWGKQFKIFWSFFHPLSTSKNLAKLFSSTSYMEILLLTVFPLSLSKEDLIMNKGIPPFSTWCPVAELEKCLGEASLRSASTCRTLTCRVKNATVLLLP